MSGAFRSAHAGPRSTAARIGLAALIACVGLTWTAGASSAFATYGTVTVKKVNDGGNAADMFHFDASKEINAAYGFDVKGGEEKSNARVEANTGSYSYRGDYVVKERPDADYELKSVDCKVDGGYNKPE